MKRWPPDQSLRDGLQRTFEAKCQPSSGCWNWTGKVERSGYGIVRRRFGVDMPRVQYKAHRLALWLAGVELSERDCVLHSCDNRRCCNPAHLRVGTKGDNARDAVERGRFKSQKGIDNSRARLNESEVACIRRWLSSGFTQRDIADFYGVAASTISAIANGRNWRHFRCSQ